MEKGQGGQSSIVRHPHPGIPDKHSSVRTQKAGADTHDKVGFSCAQAPGPGVNSHGGEDSLRTATACSHVDVGDEEATGQCPLLCSTAPTLQQQPAVRPPPLGTVYYFSPTHYGPHTCPRCCIRANTYKKGCTVVPPFPLSLVPRQPT
ncbi:hypothetical protein BS78_06G075500 [Paspalum vaginatum]|nr:hypothetical protein BS78_06G075500 [Paspalum vaginatum]